MAFGRRAFLVAGGGVAAAIVGAGALVETGVLPGRTFVHSKLGLTGEDGVIPTTPAGPRAQGRFVSEARRGASVNWVVSYPHGSPIDASLPVVIFLYGRHEDEASLFDLGIDHFAGNAKFATASVDGGPDCFWHPRRDGDSQKMLFDEFLPILAKRGLRTDKIGLFGFSMGGFGALLMGARHPDRVAAVGAIAPALWRSYDESQPGAFDNASDFEKSNVFAVRKKLEGIPLRIDCGNDDPFAPGVREFLDGLPNRFPESPAGGFQPGVHSAGFVKRVAPEHIKFFEQHLARV